MKPINPPALSLATTWTIVLITVLTIWGELAKPLKNLLASWTGHHWVTKSVLAIFFFIIVYLLLTKKQIDIEGSEKYAFMAAKAAVLSGLAIFIFFIWHYFVA
jgi:hypothetical protein